MFSDITFFMRGRRGMKDWVRYFEDRFFLFKEVFSFFFLGKLVVFGVVVGSFGRGRGSGTVFFGLGYFY